MALNLSRLKGGIPIEDQGSLEERHFVIDNDFDKEDGEIVIPTTGFSNTLYFTNSIINNSRSITEFSATTTTSFSSSGGSFTVIVQGDAGARFQLDGSSGVTVDESIIYELPEDAVDGSSSIEISGTIGSTSSTNNRTLSLNLIPYILDTPETILGEGAASTVSFSQTGVPASLSEWSISASASVAGVSSSVPVTTFNSGPGLVLNYNEGDIVTLTYTATLTSNGNVNAVTSNGGFIIVPSVHGGDSSNYTWSLTNVGSGGLLSAGPESGTNTRFGHHLRESTVSRIGESFTWNLRVDTTGLGSQGNSFTGDFPLIVQIQGTQSGYYVRCQYNQI